MCPLATREDIISLSSSKTINEDIDNFVADLEPAALRFRERRRIKKAIKSYLSWKTWIKKNQDIKKEEKKAKLLAWKKWKQAYNWKSRTILGRKRKTLDQIYTGYQINNPQYVKFINGVAQIMTGLLPWDKRWFYAYFKPSQFDCHHPSAPRTPYQIAEFLRTFTFMDKDDWAQLAIIALWEVFGDLTKLPHPWYAWRVVRLKMKKWFWWAYRETFNELVLREDLLHKEYIVDVSSLENKELVIDVEKHLSPYQQHLLAMNVHSDETCNTQENMLYIKHGWHNAYLIDIRKKTRLMYTNTSSDQQQQS